MARYLTQGLGLALALSLLLSCGHEELTSSDSIQLDSDQTKLAIEQIAAFAQRQNSNALIVSEQLLTSVRAFLASPNEESLDSLKAIWQTAHESHLAGQLGLFKDSETNARLVFSLDAWPLHPGFLDSLPAYPEGGIINDITINVDSETLRRQHGITDPAEVCLGFHALEYLIFDRPLTDFVTPDTRDLVAQSINRRRLLLETVTVELTQDLAQMAEFVSVQFQPREGQSAEQQLFLFLSSTRGYMQKAFRESSILFDEGMGHSAFSNTSTESLRTELLALQQFTLSEVTLRPILRALDPATTDNFEATLADVLVMLGRSEANEPEKAKLPLMLSVLLHRLEEFEITLKQYLQDQSS